MKNRRKYKIKINWRKVAIVVKENRRIKKLYGVIPGNIRRLNWEKREHITGEIRLRNNTNIAVNARLTKQKRSVWGFKI